VLSKEKRKRKKDINQYDNIQLNQSDATQGNKDIK
jgi:hypothetical protein